MLDFLIKNWIPLFWGLIAFIEIIVRLTPSQRDNSIFNIIKRILDLIIPNIKKKSIKDTEPLNTH